MVLLDILGRKWALRIIWELLQCRPSSFRKLQKDCGNISPTILNRRLSELRNSEIIELLEGEGYSLTKEGLTLCELFSPVNDWAKRWGKRMSKRDR
jgi:DNA-binding HxlR family transcriptional regulator